MNLYLQSEVTMVVILPACDMYTSRDYDMYLFRTISLNNLNMLICSSIVRSRSLAKWTGETIVSVRP